MKQWNQQAFLVAALAVVGGLSSVAGCEAIQGLQRATVDTTGQGGTGTGASGGTSSGGTGGTGATGGATGCQPGTTAACYTGPDGTKDKGVCKAGTKACKSDGSGYEDTCVGEVLPKAETCASTDDDDCDGNECAQWAAIFGDGAEKKPLDVGLDSAGNAYVLGAFKGALPVVNPALVSAGENDLFLVKLDPKGKVVWAKQFGDVADQSHGRLAVDMAGHVLLTATFDGTVDFGKGALGPGGTALVKLDSDGTVRWSHFFSAKLYGYVALNQDGDALFGTSFFGAVDFGKGTLDAGGGNFTDVALVKLSSASGTTTGTKQFGYPSQYEEADGIAIDGGGNIVLAGDYSESINLGGGDLKKASGNFTELFVGRFDKNGTYSTAGTYPDLNTAIPMAIDSLGNVLAGDVVDIGQAGVGSSLSKIDNMVKKVWVKGFPSDGSTNLNSIAVDLVSNNIAVALVVDAANDLGNGKPIQPIGTQDILLAKLDPTSKLLWQRRFGAAGASQDFPVIAAGPNGDIVMAAQVSGTINVGTGPLQTKGKDLLIARFAP
jgi:hypothetical protein